MTTLHLLAGASGYAYKPWKGPFYPADLPDAEMLRFYAERLPTVEINNTFYRLPKPAVLEEWAAKTPEHFIFALKASRRITHIHRLKDVGETTDYLFETADRLGPKLGPILFQLPPYMKKDLDRLRRFCDGVSSSRAMAFEFRNETWLDDEVHAVLRDHDAALCVAETEGSPSGDDLPLVATASFGYLRLRRDDYSDADLTRWLARIRAQSWARAYVFFKHEDEGTAPRLARRLLELTAASDATPNPGRRTSGPPPATQP
jgi:uncharacterized protein YecE (DUF72 family)